MKLLIGLGNPGQSYSRTRHNVGYMMMDILQSEWKASPWKDSKHHAIISETLYEEKKLFLVKPLTYMNRSGEAVQSLLSYY